jgi:hypothetical protein
MVYVYSFVEAGVFPPQCGEECDPLTSKSPFHYDLCLIVRKGWRSKKFYGATEQSEQPGAPLWRKNGATMMHGTVAGPSVAEFIGLAFPILVLS